MHPTVASAPPEVLPDARPLGGGPDMHDSSDDLARWPNLADTLRRCQEILEPIYRDADRRARAHQRFHRWIILAAAGFGTAAVILAIWELTWPTALADENAKILELLEGLAAILALFAVGLGIWARFQKEWLIQRNKAERCRFLKFRFLIQPALWSGDRAAVERCENELRQRVEELKGLDSLPKKQRLLALEEWARTDQLMEMLSTHDYGAAAAGILPELKDYYLDKRVRYQIEFLDSRIRRNDLHDRLTAPGPFWLFFLGVGCALVHFTFAKQLGKLDLWFLFFAAILPVLGAGIRTYRVAHQFACNKKRYQRCRHALEKVGEHLKDEAPPEIHFRDFVTCEKELDHEHHNWLHLMSDAEWFA